MAFVLDSSIAMARLLPDEHNAAATAVCDRMVHEAALVPLLWFAETGNVLTSAVKRGRLRRAHALRIAEALLKMPVQPDLDAGAHALTDTLKLALRLDITTYDATYLELAQRHGLPVATLDKGLRKACAKLKLPVLPEKL